MDTLRMWLHKLFFWQNKPKYFRFSFLSSWLPIHQAVPSHLVHLMSAQKGFTVTLCSSPSGFIICCRFLLCIYSNIEFFSSLFPGIDLEVRCQENTLVVVKWNDRRFISFFCHCQGIFVGPSLFPVCSNETRSCLNQLLKSCPDSLSSWGPPSLLKIRFSQVVWVLQC